MPGIPEQIDNVSVKTKANVYFDGKVVSHTVLGKAGRQTVGLIYPGSYTFNTDAPEKMEIVAGACRVKLAGASGWTDHKAGSTFKVPGKSRFDIAVDAGLAEYICTFE